ncbi:MAG: PolC-type DNA polymerase III, partial [Eubacteriaceae bacterium]
KALYGVEGYLVDGGRPVVTCGTLGTDQNFDGEFVFFDLETTGLSCKNDGIIEIAAVRIKDGRIVDSFEKLVDPHRHLSPVITKLTGLTDAALRGQAEEADAIAAFYEFCGDSVLAAHNAPFDIGFLKDRLKQSQGKQAKFRNTVIDTLPLAQLLIPDIKTYKLSRLCSYFKIKNEHAHRALEDSAASAKVLIRLLELASERGLTKVSELESLRDEELLARKQGKPWHVVIYAKNQDGLRDLYEMVSIAHLQYFHGKPRIPKSLLTRFRKNLIVGSACVAGELFQAVIDGEDDEDIDKIVEFYDYLEVQPIGNNMFMTRDARNPKTIADLQHYNEQIIEIGRRTGKLVCATGDVHFVDKEDAVFRAVMTSSMMNEDTDLQPPLYYHNTQEMLDEFKYLPEETAREIVIDNPRKIADMFESVKPVPDETYPPKIEGAEEDIRNMCEKRAHEIYGEKLPAIVRDRMEKELGSIIGNGYAVLYLIAQKLVANSEAAGYLVGSRGSVGSSFAAMLCGITEVNSLPPHYVCPKCCHSEFLEGETCVGPDLPDKVCPECGAKMNKDGYDIPFETFLGFEGDKEPDIDLNFSGDNQADAHAYTEVLFGKGKVFRAGTISTLAEKTAYGYVKHYFDEKGIYPTSAEVERLRDGCTGVKRTTGQHPGGIMVVPRDQDIFKFTPIQHPADDTESDTVTTHFDYHSISGRLLKLDILGHDDPTMLRILYENTGVNPRSIPLDDREVISLFTSTDALHFTEDCPLTLGTAGVPEFGTPFVKGMVTDTKPKSLADLIRISGLSHGTDVWNNNAQLLVRDGTAGLDEVICTRDDIMLGLIEYGLPPKTSFGIMEKVRKGKGLTPEAEALMRENKVPNWYIDSCKKI